MDMSYLLLIFFKTALTSTILKMYYFRFSGCILVMSMYVIQLKKTALNFLFLLIFTFFQKQIFGLYRALSSHSRIVSKF